MSQTAQRIRRGPTVEVLPATEVIDLDGWVRRYVAAVLRVDGVYVPAARLTPVA